MILLRQRNFTKIGRQKKNLQRAIENIVTDPKKAEKYIKLINNSPRMNKNAKKMIPAVNKAVEKTSKKTGLSRAEIGDRLSDMIG